MRRNEAALLAGAIAVLAAGPTRAASPAEGLWRSPIRHSVVQLYACGTALCGRVMSSDILKDHPDQRDVLNHDPALRSRLIQGLTILSGFSGGPPVWTDGRIYDPNNGSTYHGVLTLLDPNKVKLSGCIVAPFCGDQVWTRVE